MEKNLKDNENEVLNYVVNVWFNEEWYRKASLENRRNFLNLAKSSLLDLTNEPEENENREETNGHLL